MKVASFWLTVYLAEGIIIGRHEIRKAITGDIWKDVGENNAQNKVMRHIQQRSANKTDR